MRILKLSAKTAFRIAHVAILIGALITSTVSAGAAVESAPSITAVGFITWWSHDATGYHPAIMLRLENDSGRDLTGNVLRFQGRFTDLKYGYVTVARKEVRPDFPMGQQIDIFLPGPGSFELPINKNNWPSIECKVMCRVGEVGDEGTQDILITKLDSITMTDEEAEAQLRQRDIRRRPQAHPQAQEHTVEPKSTTHKQVKEHEHQHEVAKTKPPIAAVTAPITAPIRALAATATSLLSAEKSKTSFSKFAQSTTLPGLGDGFYSFEKSFGQPPKDDTDATDEKWTWAKFPHSDPNLTLYVGSKGHTGKADFIIASVPAIQVSDSTFLFSLARALSGKSKTEKLPAPTRSVNYLPTGRVMYESAKAKAYQALVIDPKGHETNDGNYILALSQLQGDLYWQLSDVAKSSAMLKFLRPFVAAGGDN